MPLLKPTVNGNCTRSPNAPDSNQIGVLAWCPGVVLSQSGQANEVSSGAAALTMPDVRLIVVSTGF